jgi:hypothetical protein
MRIFGCLLQQSGVILNLIPVIQGNWLLQHPTKNILYIHFKEKQKKKTLKQSALNYFTQLEKNIYNEFRQNGKFCSRKTSNSR